MPTLEDLTGRSFAKLLVLGQGGRDQSGRVVWRCRCDCGGETVVEGRELRRGGIRSCGCLKRNSRALVPGSALRMANPIEARCWSQMVDRCENEKSPSYRYYGGRGISVCARWRYGEGGKSAFECFLHDMGSRPSPLLSIDRKDNDAGYGPANCRWATKAEQAKNTRRAKAA